MLKDLRELIPKPPFGAFTIHTVDGGEIRVPTGNHIAVSPAGDRVFVLFGKGGYDTIRPLMITRLTVDEQLNGSQALT